MKRAPRRGDTDKTRLGPAGAQPVSALSGVGPKVAEKLAARGLETLQDLWLHLPLRYEDRTRIESIASLRPGQPAQVLARVEAVERSFRYRPMLRVAIGDESHGTLVLRFFHFGKAQVAMFVPGRPILCYGEVRPGQHGLEMVHPSYRLLADDADASARETLDPVYPAIEGLGPQSVARLVGEALKRLPEADELELLPAGMRERLALPTLREALLTAHRPPPDADLALFAAGRHPAQRRLALEELLAHHLSLRRQRIALRAHGAMPVRPKGKLATALRKRLAFALTGAQQRVLAATSDGFINLAAIGQTMWKRLCVALDAPQLIDEPGFGSDPERVQNRARVNAAVGAAFKTRTTADWTERLLKAGVPCGPIYTVDHMFDDPQVKHLGIARPMHHPELGDIEVVGLPMQFSRYPRDEGPLRPAPHQGDQTEAILSGLGYSPERIAELRAQFVV
mgnify:CR=1 FL=1